jgi:hypothetical protein
VLVSIENEDEHLDLGKERGIFLLVKGFQSIKKTSAFSNYLVIYFLIEKYIVMFLIIMEFYIILLTFIVIVNY